ncbi:hypothetical protein OROHE_014433 [Orobanche hederae]
MAIALTDLGTKSKMEAAASMIEKAIIANPTYAEAYNNLGLLKMSCGRVI